MYLQRYEKVPIIGNFFSFSSHSTNRNAIKIMLWKLLIPNIQRIKSIRAIGAVLLIKLILFSTD